MITLFYMETSLGLFGIFFVPCSACGRCFLQLSKRFFLVGMVLFLEKKDLKFCKPRLCIFFGWCGGKEIEEHLKIKNIPCIELNLIFFV